MGLNLISSIIVFVISLAINFFLTPFILKNLGNEAYGFVGISNAVVSYASILIVAINSLSSRFVSINFHQGKTIEASAYYSSVLLVNIAFSFFVAILSGFFIFNLNYFLQIPQNLELDIKLTFIFYFINFCIGLFNGIIGVGVFIKNKLYLISIRNAISSLILAIFTVILFYFYKPMIYYIAISALTASCFVFFSTIVINKKLNLELKFKVKSFDFNKIKEILKSGIWNSLNALNRTLIVGTDLIICNIFLGANSAGILAVSKAAPIILEGFVAQISFNFAPKFVEIYAKNDINLLVNEAKFAMKTAGFIVIAPVAFFVVFGYEFYSLWLEFKTENEIQTIYFLSLITIFPIVLISFVFPLFNLDTTTNKLFRPAIANTILGASTVIGQILVLKFTQNGLFAMGFVMAFFYSLRILCFDLINASLNLGVKISSFHLVFLKNLVIFLLICAFFYIFRGTIEIKNWLFFCLFASIFSIIGYILSIFLIFNKDEKDRIFAKITTKFKVKV